MSSDYGQSPWYQIWQSQRPKIALVSALIPLGTIIYKGYFSPDDSSFLKLSIALLTYQLSFIIALLFDAHKLLSSKKPIRITKIQQNSDFWIKNGEYRFLYLYVINGERFIEMLDEKKIKVKEIKLILPTDDAISAYYKTDPTVNDREKAKKVVIESIQAAQSNLGILASQKIIEQYEIRRVGTFPLEFFSIFDGRLCLVGRYSQDALRKNSMGLKSISWIEDNPQLVSQYTENFESVWDGLEKPNSQNN